jgi:NAD(P)-dependent dehydrogenase (short-subunit alcohol dehydrogenase family)
MAKQKQSVLITGCSSGIGDATARRLVKAGWRVIATARNAASISDLQDAGCEVLALDVTDEASMQAAVAAAGPVDALINNAGYSLSGALETLDMDAVRRQFETNVFGLLRLCQLVLPGMRAQGSGRIVNISSMGGKLTFPGGGAYHATKHAVEALSDAMRFEVAAFGIDVVVVQPGLIRTGFAEAASTAMDAGTADTGPYAGFNAAVAQATKDAYEKGPLAKLGGPPDSVAKVIARALKAKRPKTRYTVTPSASLLLIQRGLMSDRQWDGFLRQNFPQPGKEKSVR